MVLDVIFLSQHCFFTLSLPLNSNNHYLYLLLIAYVKAQVFNELLQCFIGCLQIEFSDPGHINFVLFFPPARLFHQAFISFRKYIMESSSVSADLHIILNDICCGAGKYLECL